MGLGGRGQGRALGGERKLREVSRQTVDAGMAGLLFILMTQWKVSVRFKHHARNGHIWEVKDILEGSTVDAHRPEVAHGSVS